MLVSFLNKAPGQHANILCLLFSSPVYLQFKIVLRLAN
jgi:hypothetical protein